MDEENYKLLSYMTKKGSLAAFECAHLGSNQGPTDYESVALTD